MDNAAQNIILDSKVSQEILDIYDKMKLAGELLAKEEIDKYYDTFRHRFGPDVLTGLDGVPLLEAMHGRESKDSLMYWLEFKNDAEFPAFRFGSIAGGSALKFGLFQSAITRDWITGQSVL